MHYHESSEIFQKIADANLSIPRIRFEVRGKAKRELTVNEPAKSHVSKNLLHNICAMSVG